MPLAAQPRPTAALKKLVRDAALEELAKDRQIVVTVGVGGAAVVDRQLALDHVSRQDFKDQLRFTLLEQKLSRADPKGFLRRWRRGWNKPA